MKTRLAFLLLAFAAGAAPLAAMERVVTREFPAAAGSRLILDSYRGQITLSQSDDPRIRITVAARVPSDDPAIANPAFDTLRLDFRTEGKAVRVTARDPSQQAARLDFQTDRHVDLIYTVVLPRDFGADLTDGDGSITVNNARGAFTVRMDTGPVFLRGIDGTSSVSVQTGDVTISHCTGSVDVSVLIGSIAAGTIGGRARIVTHRGYIDVQHVLGGLEARCAGGDISAGYPRGFAGNSSLQADGGNITLRVDPAAAFTLHALASILGTVTSPLPFTIGSGGMGKDHLEADLNGGGPLVEVHAAGGYVKILPVARPHALPGLP